MEIATSPHRPASTPWGRLLALVVILGPVTALVLLPIGLGLQRYVMTGDSMDGDRADSIPRGSVVFERRVPVDDLRVGDVITYRPPASAGVDGMVTHRIVARDADGIVTQGDASATPDPWRLELGGNAVPRVVLTAPWVGYAYLVLADPVLWLLLVGSAGALVLLLVTNVRRSQRTPPTPVGVGAGIER
ncbi:S26 family signal peptidase [Nocardioides sp. URHA0032]|uniref:S26 family signal peptidase n=1 Tax=Nocardioides sp. URHA0032 TaxID=1380388 RepID=UPI0006875073|nr:S26 family signal peptidase [Nocardioides sp. URHA0032]